MHDYIGYVFFAGAEAVQEDDWWVGVELVVVDGGDFEAHAIDFERDG